MKIITSTILLLLGIFFIQPCYSQSVISNDQQKQFSTLLESANQILFTDFDSSIVLSLKALNLAVITDYESNKLEALTFITNAHYNLKSDLHKSFDYLDIILHLDTSQLTLIENASIFGLKSKLLVAMDDYENAMEACFKQLKTLEGIDAPLEKARAHYNLGSINYYQKRYTQAIKFYSKAFLFYEEANQPLGLVGTYDAIGAAYGENGESAKTIYFDSLALIILDTLPPSYMKANVLLNYGFGCRKNNRFEDALSAINNALAISKEIDNKWLIAGAYHQLGACHDDLENFNAAREAYIKGDEITKTQSSQLLRRKNNEQLQSHYAKHKEYDKAYYYLYELLDLKDSLYNKERTQHLANYEIRYNSSEKEKENLILLAKKREQEMTIQRQSLLNKGLLLIIFLTFFLAFLLYEKIRSKSLYNENLQTEVKLRTEELKETNEQLQTANQQLQESNSELERFAYIASHDLKSPLRNIVSFLGLIDRKLSGAEKKDVKEYMTFAKDNAQQMYTLIQDVLEYSKISNEKRASKIQPVDLNKIITNVLENLKDDIQSKQAQINYTSLPTLNGQAIIFMQIFQNLISNGIKYNKSSPPLIILKHEEFLDKHLITITDNGIGIDLPYQEQVFEMFKRLHNQSEYKGTGLGLSICKKAVQDLGGKISIQSEVNVGTSFFISIPKKSPSQLVPPKIETTEMEANSSLK